MSAVLWNSANLVNLMEDDLDVTEVILLDGTMAILYRGWHSAGKGLMEEEAQACVNHFSPYIEWRGMAVKWDFQPRNDKGSQSPEPENPERLEKALNY